MSTVVVKGLVFSDTISSAYVAVGLVHGMKIGDLDVEVVQKDSEDNSEAVIPQTPTGRATQGDITGEMWLDSASAAHKHQFTAANAPLTYFPRNQKITSADGTTWVWSAAGSRIGVDFQSGSLVKANFTSKPAGKVTITWPS